MREARQIAGPSSEEPAGVRTLLFCDADCVSQDRVENPAAVGHVSALPEAGGAVLTQKN